MTPAGITVVRSDGAIKPLQIGSNWQITDMKENQLRQAIRQAYYSDQLQLQEGPQMTATEVQVRYELMQRLLGPTLGRFQSEFLNPLIERTFGIMFRAGALMPEPEIIKGSKINFHFEIDDYKKTCLLNGWDDIDLTLKKEKLISEYEVNHYKSWLEPREQK